MLSKKKNIVVIGLDDIVHDGSNICPQEVEAPLLEHDAVAGAGVVGEQSPMHGENVRAYVTLDAAASPPTMQDLIRFARARVGYKAPEEVIVLDEMPVNATGKVDRMALKRMAAEEGAAAAPRHAERDDEKKRERRDRERGNGSSC